MNELLRQILDFFQRKGLRVDRFEVALTDDGAVLTRKDTGQTKHCRGMLELVCLLETARWLVDPTAPKPKRIVWQ